jgi:hypothetical protein
MEILRINFHKAGFIHWISRAIISNLPNSLFTTGSHDKNDDWSHLDIRLAGLSSESA